MSASALSPTEITLQPMRLELDVELEQGTAHLRLAAAILAAAAGVWLAWVEHSVWLRLTALASVAFAARWIMNVRKSARVTRDASMHFLEITTQRVTLASGAQQRCVPFEHVERIELDEDRLAVVMRLVSGEELAIEPVYGRLGLHELAETLHRYMSSRASHTG